MDNVMQGYDLDAAVRQIGKAIGKAAKAAPDAAEAFARRAIEADMRAMAARNLPFQKETWTREQAMANTTRTTHLKRSSPK